jgi:hypothetical protein
LRKHVDANHPIINKRFEEEVNSLMDEKKERQPLKKGQISLEDLSQKNLL